MRRHALDLTICAVVATLAAVFVAGMKPEWANRALHVYLIVLGALFLYGLVAVTTATTTSRRRSNLDLALAEHTRLESRIAEVAQLERKVTLAASSAHDLHRDLLPMLREIAQARLERAGSALGPDTAGRWWELLRPDREAPADRFAPGIAERDLRALVDDLGKM